MYSLTQTTTNSGEQQHGSLHLTKRNGIFVKLTKRLFFFVFTEF